MNISSISVSPKLPAGVSHMSQNESSQNRIIGSTVDAVGGKAKAPSCTTQILPCGGVDGEAREKGCG